MPDPVPNRRRIDIFFTLYTSAKFASIAADGGCTLTVLEKVLEWCADLGDDYEKCCFLDFLIRHGGITFENAKRLLPKSVLGFRLGGTRTNSCSKCRHIGHQQQYCAW
jgi:hypothetical protein